jgi:hypothetical protein
MAAVKIGVGQKCLRFLLVHFLPHWEGHLVNAATAKLYFKKLMFMIRCSSLIWINQVLECFNSSDNSLSVRPLFIQRAWFQSSRETGSVGRSYMREVLVWLSTFPIMLAGSAFFRWHFNCSSFNLEAMIVREQSVLKNPLIASLVCYHFPLCFVFPPCLHDFVDLYLVCFISSRS